jgi:CheY-like chemotaxis protein/predicted regulator of Ras-like GTPase activity (Roadblock/LC7/MglB family)
MAEQKHILIVDDDIELGTLLAQAVSDMSPAYTVKLARDVDEAMVQVRRSQTTVNVFDLVITDIKMIGLNGIEFLEALHALAPDLKTIAMTAYNSSEIARRARELNVQAYLTKPFLISEFRQAVRDTLNAPIRHQPPLQERSTVADLVPAQRKDILHALSSLRMTTEADTVFLVRNDGVLIESDGISTTKHVTDLGTELYNAGQAITAQMTHLLGPSSDLQRSLFATDRYSICTYRVDNTYTVAVVFGSRVREGQVWYYLRETATKISRVLHAGETTPRSRSRTSGGAISDILEQFFPDPGRRSTEEAVPEDAHRRRGSDASLLSAGETHAAETEVTSFQEVDSIEADAAEDNTAEQKVAPEEPALDEPIDFSIVESIDWDAADGMSWDTVLKETDQGLGGLTFEEAQRQGLLDNLESN